MTEHLSPERETEIREWEAELGKGKTLAGVGPYTALRDTLAEMDRGRAERDRYQTAWQSARRRAARRQPHEREGLIFHLERENTRLHAFARLAHEAAEVSAKAWEQGSAEVARLREENARLRTRVADLEGALAAEPRATDNAVSQAANAIRAASSDAPRGGDA